MGTPAHCRPPPDHHSLLATRFLRKAVNICQAKAQLSEMVSRAADGEEIVIAKSGKPRARLVPLAVRPKRRLPGGGKGRVWVADDFDASLSADLLAAFDGR